MGVGKVLRVAAVGVAGMLLPVAALGQAGGQGGAGQVPTIEVNSRLVFLDVTVLDKKGQPVTEGLGKEDFSITEEKKPQRIFSFEAPERHISRMAGGEGGDPPVTIFVLDQLNSSFDQMAYIRYKIDQYLKAQPEMLARPAEILLLGEQSKIAEGLIGDLRSGALIKLNSRAGRNEGTDARFGRGGVPRDVVMELLRACAEGGGRAARA